MGQGGTVLRVGVAVSYSWIQNHSAKSLGTHRFLSRALPSLSWGWPIGRNRWLPSIFLGESAAKSSRLQFRQSQQQALLR